MNRIRAGAAALMLLSLLSLTTCGPKMHGYNLSKEPTDATTYKASDDQLLVADQQEQLRVQYLGCGGLYIRKGTVAFMVDPFFSYRKMLPTGSWKELKRAFKNKVSIRPHQESIELGMAQIKDSDAAPVSAIFTTHSHYDHLLDVPYIYQQWPKGPKPKVYGNASASVLLKKLIPAADLKNVEEDLTTPYRTGSWITISKPGDGQTVKVLPIRAEHAPHLKNIKLFDGEATKSFTTEEYPTGTKMADWLEGQTVSYLVDYITGKDTTYRVFIQTSASSPVLGIPPAHIVNANTKKVDLAIICMASYDKVASYPETLLTKLSPKQVMVVHWEDFMLQTYQKAITRPRSVPATNLDTFLATMEKLKSQLGFTYFMPRPGISKVL